MSLLRQRNEGRFKEYAGIIAILGFGMVVILGFLSSNQRRRMAATTSPISSLIGFLSEGHGLAENSVDSRWIIIEQAPWELRDGRTGFTIEVSDLLGLTHDCDLQIVEETPSYLVSCECLIVFVVGKETKKIEAITTLPDFEQRGQEIVVAVSHGLSTVSVNQARGTANDDGHEMAGRFSGKRLRNLVARFRDLCEANELGEMQSMVDPLRILVDSRHGIVIDLRTGYRISFERIKSLRDTCPVGQSGQDGPVQVIVFCEHTGYREARVVFLVSPDWKIRAIMDEATWKRRGEEIVAEIRKELSVAGEQDQPAEKGSPRIPETSGEDRCPPQQMNPRVGEGKNEPEDDG